jgi:uncharacterized membrane protein YhaH (DUF805 family)
MSMTQLLFLFQGRLNRQPYWLIAIAIAVVVILLVLFALATGFEGDFAGSGAIFLILGILYIPLVWIGLAISAKRLHDRNKSAWWLIVFYIVPGILGGIAYQIGMAGAVLHIVSFGITVWAFVELGCLRGTRGPNRYGPDPLTLAA